MFRIAELFLQLNKQIYSYPTLKSMTLSLIKNIRILLLNMEHQLFLLKTHNFKENFQDFIIFNHFKEPLFFKL
jgi:hypothetical protein